MKLLKDIILTVLLVTTFIWVITQGDTTDGGKLIRMGSFIFTGILCAKYSRPGQYLIRKL